jgi:preprotein translocase subunit YajC
MHWILAASASGEGNPLMNMLVIMVPMIVLFYFLLIRPQRKQESQRRAMIDSLKKNDRVLTNGGLYGTVANVMDDEISIRVDDARDVKVRVAKNAISAVVNRKEDGE